MPQKSTCWKLVVYAKGCHGNLKTFEYRIDSFRAHKHTTLVCLAHNMPELLIDVLTSVTGNSDSYIKKLLFLLHYSSLYGANQSSHLVCNGLT